MGRIERRFEHWLTEHALGLCILGSVAFWAALALATAMALPHP